MKLRQKRFQDNLWLKQRPFCHRGKHGGSIIENTILAFEKSIEMNFPFEFDVRLTKDKKVVCFHDNNLMRMFNVRKKVNELTYEELNNIKEDFHFPLFKEVLDLVDGKVGLMIEIKADKIGELENLVIKQLEGYKGKYVFVSFNPLSLRYMRKNKPEILRGQISSNFSNSKMNWIKKVILKKMLFNFLSKPDFISYDINDFDEKILLNFKKKNYYIFGYTYKSRKKELELREIFDNVIYENIEIESFKG